MENLIDKKWKLISSKFGNKIFKVALVPVYPLWEYDPEKEDGDFLKALSDYYDYFLNL